MSQPYLRPSAPDKLSSLAVLGEGFAPLALAGSQLPKHLHQDADEAFFVLEGQPARAFQVLTPGGVENGLAEVVALTPEEVTPQRIGEIAARANMILLPD